MNPERSESLSNFNLRAEVAKRTTAPVLKTGGALRHGSSNLPLSVSISKDNSSKNKVNYAQKGINTKDFEKFLKVQRNLSPRTIEGHLYHLSNFINVIGNIDEHEAIQDFLLKVTYLGLRYAQVRGILAYAPNPYPFKLLTHISI